MLDRVTGSLERYMDLLSTRQKLVASNIANADTPGFKTQDIDFHFEFMSLAEGDKPTPIEAPGLQRRRRTATMSRLTASRGYWPRTPSASARPRH